MIQGRWMPQTQQEWELLEDMHAVTRLAAAEGVSRARIASLTAYMAAAAAQQAAIEDTSQTDAQRQRAQSDLASRMGEERTSGDLLKCPECGGNIEDISGGLGSPQVEPCGCILDGDEDVIEEVMDRE